MEWDLVLNGAEEFYPGLNDKKYWILKTDTTEKIK